MNEALGVDERDEANRIDALEAALAALDPNATDARTRATRDQLHVDLFAARGRRIERLNAETSRRLEGLVGHSLGR